MSSLFDFDDGAFLFKPAPRKHDSDRRRERPSVPPADILESPKSYTFFLDVPGLAKSDIQVTLEDDCTLVVSSNGKRKREEEGDGEEEGCRYLRMERRASGRFSRRFRLPEDADAGAITARCENGVLTVVVGKQAPPENKVKKVEVTVT